jgi:hypothetical protein
MDSILSYQRTPLGRAPACGRVPSGEAAGLVPSKTSLQTCFVNLSPNCKAERRIKRLKRSVWDPDTYTPLQKKGSVPPFAGSSPSPTRERTIGATTTSAKPPSDFTTDARPRAFLAATRGSQSSKTVGPCTITCWLGFLLAFACLTGTVHQPHGVHPSGRTA